MTAQYDAIVIGSGCGGAASAALAGYRGLRTLLLEKNKYFGGRAATFERDGFKLDHGHIISRCQKGPHGDLLRLVKCADMIPDFFTYRKMRFYGNCLGIEFDGTHTKLAKSYGILKAIPKILGSGFFSILDIPGVILLGSRILLMKKEAIREWDEVPLQKFLDDCTGSELMHSMIGSLNSASFGVTNDEVSAGEFIRTYQALLREGNNVGYPATGEGVDAIPKSFLRAAAKYGAQIESRKPVERVVVENGRVKGVYVKGELIEAPVVISNAGIRETTYTLVGKDYFAKEFIQYLENLQYGYGGISLKYGLDKPVTDFHFAFKVPRDFSRNMHDALDGRLPEEFSVLMVGTSSMDPRLAPPGKQTLLAIAPGPVTEPGQVDWEPWVKRLRRQIEEDFLPVISRHILFCEATTPDVIARQNSRFLGDAIGTAQSISQVGKNAPACISPIQGLYYVGADVGSKWIASEMATQSAIDLFGELDEKGLLSQVQKRSRKDRRASSKRDWITDQVLA